MVNQPPSHTASAERSTVRRVVRVLMVVDGRYPATGGAEMQARLLARALSEAGHTVRVLAPRLEPTAATRERVDGVEVIRLAYPRWRGLGAAVLNLRFASWLLRHQRDYDAIHIHMMHNLAGAAGWLQPLLKPRLVVKVSGAAEFQGGILDPAKRSAWKHRLLGAGARRLDAFQCISAHTARVLGEAGYPAQRLWRVPNAVQVARFQPAQPGRTSDVRVVFVGRHVAVKGLDVLLRAWSLLPAPRGARLVLAGDGPESPRLRALARELGVDGEVDFPGLVDDVPALLRGASLYVQPSHSEGLPNAVLEAMAAGLPVVATRISGHEDVLDHGLNGLLVPAGDAPAMVMALQRLLGDASMREAMGAQAREHMLREFDVPVVLRRLVCLYTQGVVPPAGTTMDTEPA